MRSDGGVAAAVGVEGGVEVADPLLSVKDVGAGITVADGPERACEDISVGCEITIVDVTAAAPCPIVITEVEPSACPRVRVVSLAAEVMGDSVDVPEGPCPKNVVTGTIVVVSRLK